MINNFKTSAVCPKAAARTLLAWFAMLGDIMTLTDLPLHVVELDKLLPVDADGIRKRGRKVYDAPPTR